MPRIDYESVDFYAAGDIADWVDEDLVNITEPLKKLPKLAALYRIIGECLDVKDLRDRASDVAEQVATLTTLRDLLKKIKALLPKMQREFEGLIGEVEPEGPLVDALEALPTVDPLCELGRALERIVLKMKEDAEAYSAPATDVIGNYITSECGIYQKVEALEFSFDPSDLNGDLMVPGLLAGYLEELRGVFEEEDEEES